MATSFLVGKTDGEVPASSPFRTGSLATDVPLLDLAAAGDPESMLKLEAKKPEDLSVNEIVALASGRAVQNKTALGTLSNELRQNPALQNDAEVMKRLREAFEDPELAREALHTIALLPDSKSADLLYEVWVGTRERTPTTQLAQALVYTKEVRGKASPSLLVALDLRRASSCEEVKPIVSRAVQHADRRSLRLLGMLTVRKGCAPQKLEDCYECLRDDEVLEEAIKVARSRMDPKL